MSVTEDAPNTLAAAPRSPARRPGRARRASPWSWLVAGSALVLAAVGVALAVWWLMSRETRIVTYRVVGTLSAVDLDVGAAPVQIAGGAGGAVEVRRDERFAFGRPPRETRAVERGGLKIASRCPDTVLGTCRAAYRVTVPDNVQVNVRTSSGRVAIVALNASSRVTTGSGPIAIDRFCGFTLIATSASGDVRAGAACSPDRVELRSSSGNVRAVVPTGRYRVDAHSDRGATQVTGLIVADDASNAVQALSGSGDVTVEGGRP
jgi:Putative adhesin